MLSISRTEANSPDNEGGTGQTGIRNVIEMPPIVPVQYHDGKWGEKGDYPQSEQGSNPIQQLKYMDLISRNNYILMNIGADVHLTDDLTTTVRANYQNNSAKSTDVRKAGLRDYSPESSGNQPTSTMPLRPDGQTRTILPTTRSSSTTNSSRHSLSARLGTPTTTRTPTKETRT